MTKMLNGPPWLRAGFVPADALEKLTREALEHRSGSYADLAQDLGRSASEIGNAAGADPSPQVELRRQIIEALTPYTVEGPYYRVRRK